ncbi:hypothetical protein [Vibrio owensii]|uniref:hypothetical protein n=1 Tax=Vibrio harveyi group TaxID=717610 RepID=UPI003CC60725
MKVVVSETYQIATPESIEAGEYHESGFVEEQTEYTLDELKERLSDGGFIEPSDSLITSKSNITSSVIENRDYFEKGIQETRTIHLVKLQNDDGSEISTGVADKVWRKILLEAAGINHQHEPGELTL